MNQSKIAVRYAKALFQVAQEKNILEELKKDMEQVALTCEQSDFILLLESPLIKTDRKREIMAKIFTQKVNDLTLRFLLMVADNKREVYIPGICRNFIDQYRLFKGIKAAKVTTASSIDNETKQQIAKVISDLFNTEVELTTEENSELLGGFILRVGDDQIDASVATKLNKIKREFLDTSV
ncbi:MAG: ATP synthase F1 subunit delta [Salinivirgaceae bacterium]|nr:ATP synthase F1 subunit delta [Salinivirgaceae bacterium]